LLNAKLLAAGFTRLIHDRNAKTFVVTYVDDIIVTGNSTDEIHKTIEYFATEFMKIFEKSIASLVSI
jgi:hypothetical protein